MLSTSSDAKAILPQQQTYWCCWASAAQDVLAENGVFVSQADIVSQATGWPMNRPAYTSEIAMVLRQYGLPAQQAGRPPTVYELLSVLNAVTEEVIRNAMKDAPLQSQQAGGVSLPTVQRYVDKLLAGEVPPAIKVDGNMIVDGNHRYIAGQILGQETPMIEWLGGRPGGAIPWSDIKFRATGEPMVTIRCQTGEDVLVEGDSLVGARLSGLNLHRALLDRQVLEGADLAGAELRSAWLEGAVLNRGNLARANLFSCVATGAAFRGAALTDAVLATGIFDKADFTQADLRGSRVGLASFKGAILDGADLRCEGLERASLEGARADASTRWPDGFNPAKHGVEVRR